MRRTVLRSKASGALAVIDTIHPSQIAGRVSSVTPVSVEVIGLEAQLSVGDRVKLEGRQDRQIIAEVVGFRGRAARAMVFNDVDGIGPGTIANIDLQTAGNARELNASSLFPSLSWLGRVIDPTGKPLDGRGQLQRGTSSYPVRASPPEANQRARLGPRLDLGVTALNIFTTCRKGQRLGLFAGSGIGKSTLLAMLARYASCDVIVLGLVGERGREVREFLEDDLGSEGLARAVVVTATSDMQPLMRREAAYAAMTIAEYFRDQGKSVLLLMDSLTRFCFALRDIGLAAGEPPATRGYPPSVFTELPRLLERAGPGLARDREAAGEITALFTVLVEGDDHNEPVADAVRGILDGHIILDRQIGISGRYPAVNVLHSLSRTARECLSEKEAALVQRARGILATHAGMIDLIRLGAYKPGTTPEVDEAVLLAPRIEAALCQGRSVRSEFDDGFASLASAMEIG